MCVDNIYRILIPFHVSLLLLGYLPIRNECFVRCDKKHNKNKIKAFMCIHTCEKHQIIWMISLLFSK